MIQVARQLPNKGYADVNLTISHAERRRINAAVMAQRLAEERPEAVLRIPKGADPNSQEMVVWHSPSRPVVLTAVLDSVSRHGTYNAQLLAVQGWSAAEHGDGTLHLRCTEGGAEYSVPVDWAQQNLRYGAAICYAAIQGRTCHGTVALWSWGSKRMTRRHLVLGLSRATSIDKVWLGEA